MFGSIILLATLTSAQMTSLWIPRADPQSLVGSIIGSDANAKTYAIQCAPGTDGSDCGIAGGIYLTEGSATAGFAITLAGDSDLFVLASFFHSPRAFAFASLSLPLTDLQIARQASNALLKAPSQPFALNPTPGRGRMLGRPRM
jgi:hypothetical protein